MLENARKRCLKSRLMVFPDGTFEANPERQGAFPRGAGCDHRPEASAGSACGGGLVPWTDFDDAFRRFYKTLGRPANATRMMVGLRYLEHTFDLSDELTK